MPVSNEQKTKKTQRHHAVQRLDPAQRRLSGTRSVTLGQSPASLGLCHISSIREWASGTCRALGPTLRLCTSQCLLPQSYTGRRLLPGGAETQVRRRTQRPALDSPSAADSPGCPAHDHGCLTSLTLGSRQPAAPLELKATGFGPKAAAKAHMSPCEVPASVSTKPGPGRVLGHQAPPQCSHAHSRLCRRAGLPQ